MDFGIAGKHAPVCGASKGLGHAKTLAACMQPDILINNAGGSPTGDFRNRTSDDWIAAIVCEIAV